MNSVYSLQDYCARHFEYKQLSKIHGQPNIDSTSKKERLTSENHTRRGTTRDNQAIQPSSCTGGGLFRNSKRPIDPGTFFVIEATRSVTPLSALESPTSLTTAEIATNQIAHGKQKRLFNECQTVKSMLRNQIIDAIEYNYLQPLRNVMTYMINDTITNIFTCLLYTYGRLLLCNKKA